MTPNICYNIQIVQRGLLSVSLALFFVVTHLSKSFDLIPLLIRFVFNLYIFLNMQSTGLVFTTYHR